MKLHILTLLMLFNAFSLIGMEISENETAVENTHKKVKTIALPQPTFQPRSLKDAAGRIAFSLLPQQPNLDELFPTIPTELTEEYINKPLDCTERTPLYCAQTKNIFSLIQHGAKIDIKNKIGISPIEYFIQEGNYQAALQILSSIQKEQVQEKKEGYFRKNYLLSRC